MYSELIVIKDIHKKYCGGKKINTVDVIDDLEACALELLLQSLVVLPVALNVFNLREWHTSRK